MAQNLQLLKRRIKTAKNISQIAKAMEMISASKIKRAQTAVENNKPYAKRVTRLTTKLIKNLGTEKFEHSYIHNPTDSKRKLLIALSPEGTRKKVDKLRTGFYHIAKEANVPIIMVGMDYSKKELSVAEPFFVSSNEAEDFKKIIRFFAPIKGGRPEQGLSHLLEVYNA